MKKLLLLSCIFSRVVSFSQENNNLSIGLESNSQYYLNDSKTGHFTEVNRFRSNNYLKVDYVLNHFYFGLQLESYEPKMLLNYSPDLNKTNFGLYYTGYKNKKLNITIGHFYDQFGSGLILRSWEDRQLGINNALKGIRIKYSPTNYIELTSLYGKQRKGFDISNGTIYGFNTDVNISDAFQLENYFLNIGFSYIGRTQNIPATIHQFNNLTNSFATRLDLTKGNFYSSIEYVSKEKDAVIISGQTKNTKKGSAYFVNFGYTKKGLGIDATFRRLENMTFYSEREASGNIYNQSTINYLPALTKQHDYSLSNIYVYQAQPQVSFQDPTLMKSGEIGGQIDLFFSIKKGTILGGRYGTKIAINTSFWSGLKGDYDYINTNYNTSFLGFGENYYSDFSVEVRKKWSKQWNSIFYYVNQRYNKRYIEETFGKVNTNIVIGEATYKLGKGKSLRFEAQHLWTKDDTKNWIGSTVEFNTNSQLAFYINDIYNYGNDNVSKKTHYYNLGGSYTYKAHRFSMNYGRQRGGLLCIGGVCRYVAESTGISASIIMSF
jgi:hypothetical protein